MTLKDKMHACIDNVMLGLTFTITIFALVFLDFIDRVLHAEGMDSEKKE